MYVFLAVLMLAGGGAAEFYEDSYPSEESYDCQFPLSTDCLEYLDVSDEWQDPIAHYLVRLTIASAGLQVLSEVRKQPVRNIIEHVVLLKFLIFDRAAKMAFGAEEMSCEAPGETCEDEFPVIRARFVLWYDVIIEGILRSAEDKLHTVISIYPNLSYSEKVEITHTLIQGILEEMMKVRVF